MKNVIFCLLPLAPFASAEVRETLDFNEYVVRADGERSLTAAINKASPFKRGDRVFHGYTTWNVRWNYRWNTDSAGLCRITESRVKLGGAIQLPKLVDGTAAQQRAFSRYIGNLRQHELGHFDFGKKAAYAIDSFILSLPARGDCATLEREANDGAQRLLAEQQRLEKQYDLDTGHGRTQGAWLTE